MGNYFDGKYYYKIRKKTFWWIVALAVIVVLTIAVFFQSNTDEDERGEYVEITYDHLESKLVNAKECYLCGNNARSLMSYYRKFDTIGVISLNDWYVIDLRLKEYDSQGNKTESDGSASMWHTNNGNISYDGTSNTSRGMADMQISLPQDYKLDENFLENNLCASCLNKVVETLEHSYFENEATETIPLCVVDFDTLELYSIQDHYRSYFIRDYLVELDFDEENEINISAYYLPER